MTSIMWFGLGCFAGPLFVVGVLLLRFVAEAWVDGGKR